MKRWIAPIALVATLSTPVHSAGFDGDAPPAPPPQPPVTEAPPPEPAPNYLPIVVWAILAAMGVQGG